MKIFCYNCGSKIEFSAANKPKFCSSCGSPLDPSHTKANTQVNQTEEEAGPENSEFSGNISKLDVDFLPTQKNTIKLQDALGSNAGGVTDGSNLDAPSISKEDFEKQWQKEAGTLRQNSSQESDE